MIEYAFKLKNRLRNFDFFKNGTKDKLIDLDANPFLPGEHLIEEHRGHGLFKFNPLKISLYGDEPIKGYDLRKKLASLEALNANVLDWLLVNQDYIPEEWKGKYINFWGTIYRRYDDSLYVRCLYWSGSRWCDGENWVGRTFDSSSPAAILN